MEKSADRSCPKYALRTFREGTTSAGSLIRAVRANNNQKIARQLAKCQQSNLSQASTLQSEPVMKRKFEKSAGASPKVSSVYNLRSKSSITEAAKDSPGYNLRSKVQKTESGNASTKIIPKKVASVQKRIQRKESQKSPPLKIYVPPIDKNLTTFMASLDEKEQPLSSPYEPDYSEPMYHIRWEGDDMDNGPVGQNCIICNKDLSGVIEDDDSEYDEDLQYEDDDEDDDDVMDYYDDLNPPLLPAVDILACGHAYHTECYQKGTSEKQSSDPECTVCSKNA